MGKQADIAQEDQSLTDAAAITREKQYILNPDSMESKSLVEEHQKPKAATKLDESKLQPSNTTITFTFDVVPANMAQQLVQSLSLSMSGIPT